MDDNRFPALRATLARQTTPFHLLLLGTAVWLLATPYLDQVEVRLDSRAEASLPPQEELTRITAYELTRNGVRGCK